MRTWPRLMRQDLQRPEWGAHVGGLPLPGVKTLSITHKYMKHRERMRLRFPFSDPFFILKNFLLEYNAVGDE